MITLYSRAGCAPCAYLKLWFARKGVSYTELSPEGTDIRIVPTTIIGNEIIIGPNIKRIVELLNI